MRKIAVWALQPGMKVGKAVYDSNGKLLLNEGIALKDKYIFRLRQMGVPAIYIKDDLLEDVVVEDVILDKTRMEATRMVKNIMQDAEQNSKNKGTRLILPEKDIKKAINNITNDLINNTNIVVNLTDIRTADNYTFGHSVNVAVLSIMTGISIGLSRHNLQILGVGAILHDLGKVKIPPVILNKKGKLTPEEFEIVKKHPSFGLEIYEKQSNLHDLSGKVIYQHHERINGKGYPQGLLEDDIHHFAKITAVADVYDALVACRPYRNAFLPHQAIELLCSKTNEFDVEVIRSFINHVAAYPVGTTVQLSSGEIGVVVHNTAGFPLRPRVRIFYNNSPVSEPYEVDLREKMDIVISTVIPDDDYKTFKRKVL